MDIYQTAETARSNIPLGKNKGIVITNTSGSNIAYQLFTFGTTGATYSLSLMATSGSTYLFPVRVWGISFDSATGIAAFGVS